MVLRFSENRIRGVDPLSVWVAVGTTRTARPMAPKQKFSADFLLTGFQYLILPRNHESTPSLCSTGRDRSPYTANVSTGGLHLVLHLTPSATPSLPF